MSKRDHPLRGGKLSTKDTKRKEYGKIPKNTVDQVRKYHADWTPHKLIAKHYKISEKDVAKLCEGRPRNPKRYCLCGCGEQVVRSIGVKPGDFGRKKYVNNAHRARVRNKKTENALIDDVKLSLQWLMSRDVGHTSDRRLWAWREILRRNA